MAVTGLPAICSEPETDNCQAGPASSFSNTNPWSSHPPVNISLSYSREGIKSQMIVYSDGYGTSFCGEREKDLREMLGWPRVTKGCQQANLASFCDEKSGFLAKN